MRMLLAGIMLLLVPALVQAETLLRWKLKAGEAFSVEMSQQTQSQVDFSGKSATTKMDVAMRLAWRVVEANDEVIKVEQTVEHVRVSLSSPSGSADFDSDNQARATGLAKQLADSLQPLVGAQFEVLFTPLGEVKSALPVNDRARSLLADKDKADDAAPNSRVSLVQLVSQSIVELPEKPVAEGEPWTATREIASAAGRLRHETTYVLQERDDREGKQVARIGTTGRLQEQPAQGQKPASAIQIKSHEQTGTVRFAIDLGRPLEIEQQQSLATQRTYRDSQIGVLLTSQLKMTFKASAKN